MTHRYFSYFFWTGICLILAFTLFATQFQMNIFSGRHWMLLLKYSGKAPQSLWISWGGVAVFWLGGLAFFRFRLKESKMVYDVKSGAKISVTENGELRPKMVSESSYVPEEHHYKPSTYSPPAQKRDVPKIKVPQKIEKKIEQEVVEAKEEIYQVPVQSPVQEEKVSKPSKVDVSQKEVSKKKEIVDLLSVLKEKFSAQKIKIVDSFAMGNEKIDFYALTDDALFLGKIFQTETGIMMPETEKFEDQTPSWMLANKERISSPPAVMLGLFEQVKEMCNKAFKENIPFEIKPFILFSDQDVRKFDMLKEKYQSRGLSVLNAEDDSLVKFISGAHEEPSKSFVSFSATLAHYFDSNYPLQSNDEDS
ncbi:MAG: hypothetical protein JXR30_02360 [Alphaproteobacteria bacterium]|nr:hypothetical protein [Alphaproteobacteria bacterium]